MLWELSSRFAAENRGSCGRFPLRIWRWRYNRNDHDQEWRTAEGRGCRKSWRRAEAFVVTRLGCSFRCSFYLELPASGKKMTKKHKFHVDARCWTAAPIYANVYDTGGRRLFLRERRKRDRTVTAAGVALCRRRVHQGRTSVSPRKRDRLSSQHA